MSETTNPTPAEETPGKENLEDAGTEGVSEDETASTETQPGSTDPAGEVFHKEGNREFKTKDDYVSWVNQQRGEASRLANSKKQAEAKLLETAQALEKANAIITKLTSQTSDKPPEKKDDEEVSEEQREAIRKLKKIGKFITNEEFETITKQIESIQQERQTASVQAAEQAVAAFKEANPNIEGHEQELADLIQAKGLTLDEAYLLHFGEKPKPPKAESARTALEKGKTTAIRKAQAGGTTPGGKAAPGAATEASPVNWSKLKE